MSAVSIKQEVVDAFGWQQDAWPDTADGWIERARSVGDLLAEDAVVRDRANRSPHAEVELLKNAGLVTLLAPKALGGGGQRWSTAYRVIREVARGDGSIGQLLGYHYLWAWAARLVGTPDQIEAIERHYAAGQLFFGGAVNPRDNDLKVTDTGDTLVFNGRKSFSTGSGVTDLTVLEGVLENSGEHVFAVVDSRQDGLEFLGDWDNLGQRLTESGGVVIRDVEVPWSDALGFANKRYQPSVYATLNVPAIQLVFTSFYLGIAEGALAAALEYNRRHTRPWPYGGDNKTRAADEFYVLDGFGDLQSRLWASQAFVEQTVAVVDALLHRPREAVKARERGEAAVKVAAAKQRIVDTGLDIATRLYELTGARASANKYGFDIYWRNLRTHSLHDPIAYKRVEVGRFALLDEIPEPTWYT